MGSGNRMSANALLSNNAVTAPEAVDDEDESLLQKRRLQLIDSVFSEFSKEG